MGDEEADQEAPLGANGMSAHCFSQSAGLNPAAHHGYAAAGTFDVPAAATFEMDAEGRMVPPSPVGRAGVVCPDCPTRAGCERNASSAFVSYGRDMARALEKGSPKVSSGECSVLLAHASIARICARYPLSSATEEFNPY